MAVGTRARARRHTEHFLGVLRRRIAVCAEERVCGSARSGSEQDGVLELELFVPSRALPERAPGPSDESCSSDAAEGGDSRDGAGAEPGRRGSRVDFFVRECAVRNDSTGHEDGRRSSLLVGRRDFRGGHTRFCVSLGLGGCGWRLWIGGGGRWRLAQVIGSGGRGRGGRERGGAGGRGGRKVGSSA